MDWDYHIRTTAFIDHVEAVHNIKVGTMSPSGEDSTRRKQPRSDLKQIKSKFKTSQDFFSGKYNNSNVLSNYKTAA
jgi:hypothetical protein